MWRSSVVDQRAVAAARHLAKLSISVPSSLSKVAKVALLDDVAPVQREQRAAGIEEEDVLRRWLHPAGEVRPRWCTACCRR